VSDPVAEGYFPVLQARRNGAVVAASATEGILTLDSGARSASEGVPSSAFGAKRRFAEAPVTKKRKNELWAAFSEIPKRRSRF